MAEPAAPASIARRPMKTWSLRSDGPSMDGVATVVDSFGGMVVCLVKKKKEAVDRPSMDGDSG